MGKRYSYGDFSRPSPRVSFARAPNQKEALKLLAQQTVRSITDYEVALAARAITSDCHARDDQCELQAIYDAVKHGTDKLDWLQDGVRYVLDSRNADQFFAPTRLIQMCKAGSCAGDCDDQAAFLCALAGSLGFKVGLYAWAPKAAEDYEHVLAVAMVPKANPKHMVALDTTVEDATLGWKPPPGRYLIAWLN